MGKRQLSILKQEKIKSHKPQHGKVKKKLSQAPDSKRPAAPKAKPAVAAVSKRAAVAAAKRQADAQQADPSDSAHDRTWKPHSPVLRHAAEALAKLLASDESRRSGASIKALTLAPHVTAKKATFALTCQTLRYLPVIQKVLKTVQLLEHHEKVALQLPASVAYVMCYEVLFGQSFKPTGPAEWCMIKAKATLREALQNLIESTKGAKTAEDLLPATLKKETAARPRTVRVNTLKMSVEAALDWLASPPEEHRAHAAKGKGVERDDLLPDVLVFPSGTDLHDHPLVADRSLILQSRASCMAAHALGPAPGMHVVDCCAAPGNKTTHVAALVGPSGRVDAFELDPKRAAQLERNVEASAAANVTVHQGDFLQADVDSPDFADVQAVLLDPSCSGSGTTHSRMDFLLPSHWQHGADTSSEVDEERLEKLAQFQASALRHALQFPQLQRLVYSTCSVHERENEAVVAAVLPFAQEQGFRLVDPFPSWHRRGLPVMKGAEKLVRVDPDLDGTDGFFIAAFQRKSAATQKSGSAEKPASSSAGPQRPSRSSRKDRSERKKAKTKSEQQ